MIPSEQLNFDLPTHGSFQLDGDGLQFLGPVVDIDGDNKAWTKELTESANEFLLQSNHITPLEVFARVVRHFGFLEWTVKPRISKRETIEAPPKGANF
jgi:hypothetical protein